VRSLRVFNPTDSGVDAPVETTQCQALYEPQRPAACGDGDCPAFEDWFDPIEPAVRERVHGFIQAMIEAEPEEALSRTRYARRAKACPGSIKS
jgi:hypothetical protein